MLFRANLYATHNPEISPQRCLSARFYGLSVAQALGVSIVNVVIRRGSAFLRDRLSDSPITARDLRLFEELGCKFRDRIAVVQGKSSRMEIEWTVCVLENLMESAAADPQSLHNSSERQFVRGNQKSQIANAVFWGKTQSKRIRKIHEISAHSP
jgi:hypothetical protein